MAISSKGNLKVVVSLGLVPRPWYHLVLKTCVRSVLVMIKEFPTIRAVAFDYGGVLAYFITPQSVRKMADVAQVDGDSFESAVWKFRHELDSGAYDNTSYWTAVLDYCNSPVPQQQSIIETLVEMDLEGFSRMNQGMLCWAKQLQESGFGTVIISNMAEPTYQRLMVQQEWIQYFDVTVISGVIGINKPDHRIFNHALKQMQLEAAQVLFLDDLPHNVAGAKEAGLHALLFSDTQTLAQKLKTNFPNLPVTALSCSTE